jgi:[glutamine synthetase] adenylyltransferase / [glutamine synthetase]-adenylyl-L-tyrosine phosphorylase
MFIAACRSHPEAPEASNRILAAARLLESNRQKKLENCWCVFHHTLSHPDLGAMPTKGAKKAEPLGRRLVERIAAAPIPSDPAGARATMSAWLGDVARTNAGKTLKQLLAGSTKLQCLIEGLADGSPYLWDLATSDPDRLVALLQADPDEHLTELLSESAAALARCSDEGEAMRLLRRTKAEAALLIALADLGGVWPIMQVAAALTRLADTAVAGAVRFLLNQAIARGQLTALDRERPEDGCGLIVLAMGKMGAFELNYSSDIDLIVLFDHKAPALAEGLEAGPVYLRIARGLVKLLQERTGDGYVFRVDLRLRPDPASTQIAVSTESALVYYESTGQNWERAAMIKARPCAGDTARGEAFLNDIAPFVWRKYFDFAAVADVHAMKRQIHAYRGHEEIAVEGHNIKLGRGGIREVEFFVQTQQLIAGGRNPALRGRQTLATLAGLAEGGWISADARVDLEAAYLFLRSVEHRLQMVADEQTHTLPTEREELDRFARFLGFADRDAFAQALLDHLRKVQGHYSRLFEDAPALAARRHALVFTPETDSRETLDKLAEMGFQRPVEAAAAVRRWLKGEYRALRGEVARSHLAELIPVLLDELSRSEYPDGAIIALDRFLAGLSGGARLISLLRQNPDFVALLTVILGTAPRLGDILARHPQVMDALIDPTFFGALPDEAKLNAQLAASLGQSTGYEDYLDRVRLFGNEHMFLIGARILSGTLAAGQAGEAFARLADVLVAALHRAVKDNLAQTHGRLRGQESAILAMGKLGGREMAANSDLDLILIYDFDERHPESDGARPLYGAQYFARLTQRLINALSAQTNYGSLYQVDMRLRPSGRSGPVATKIDSFEGYQENEAWTWEHMALTRARVVSASSGFRAKVEKVIRDVLCRPRDPELIAGDVVEMRRAIAAEKGDDRRWDIKYAAGGLIDLEFIAQYLQLVHAEQRPEILDTSTARVLDRAWRFGLIETADAECLRAAVRLYHDLSQILRLCLSGPFDPKQAGAGLLGLLTRAADVPDFATLEAHLADTQARVRASFTRILGAAP